MREVSSGNWVHHVIYARLRRPPSLSLFDSRLLGFIPSQSNLNSRFRSISQDLSYDNISVHGSISVSRLYGVPDSSAGSGRHAIHCDQFPVPLPRIRGCNTPNQGTLRPLLNGKQPQWLGNPPEPQTRINNGKAIPYLSAIVEMTPLQAGINIKYGNTDKVPHRTRTQISGELLTGLLDYRSWGCSACCWAFVLAPAEALILTKTWC
jgi:hypothetical protein